MEVQLNPTVFKNDSAKPKKKRNVGKSIGAHLIGAVSAASAQMLCGPVSDLMVKVDSNGITVEHKDQLKYAAKQVLEASGLKEKGVQIIYHPTEKVPKTIKEYIRSDVINDLKRGTQAFYSPTGYQISNISIPANSVNLPENGLYTSFSHELGHAMNAHGSKFSKFIGDYRFRTYPLRITSLAVLLSAFTSTREPEEVDGLSKKDKIHNALRNNAFWLPIIASVPMLIEEGLASLKGEKHAKKWLPKDLNIKMLIANRIAFSSYLVQRVHMDLGFIVHHALRI